MRGTLIVLDGTDGSGKDTQADLLLDSAKKRGISAGIIRYPGYERTQTGKVIRSFLQGKYGELDAVHPKIASYLFATDRFELKAELNELLEKNELVIASRYTASNLAYQAARLPEEERSEFRQWVTELEYKTFSSIKEDAVIFLDLPIEQANELIALRKNTERDIHDENDGLRRAVREQYHELARLNPHWHVIACNEEDSIRSKESIANELSDLVFHQLLREGQEESREFRSETGGLR